MKYHMIAAALVLFSTSLATAEPVRIYVTGPESQFVDARTEAALKVVERIRKEFAHKRHAKLLQLVDNPEQAALVLRVVSADKEQVPNTGKGFWGDLGQHMADDVQIRQGNRPMKERNTVEQTVIRSVLQVGEYETELVYGASTRPGPDISTQTIDWIKKNQATLQAGR